jgi:hypothetical protein
MKLWLIFRRIGKMLNKDEILKNGGHIIDLHFRRYIKLGNTLYMNDILNFINDYAYPNWETFLSYFDIKNQLTLFLFSRYTMELFSFYINIEKTEILKNIMNETDLLNEEIKSYIIKKKYSNIKKYAINSLKLFFQRNKFVDKNIRDHFFKNDQLKIWGDEEIIKDYERRILIEEEEEKIRKYKSSLEVISLSDDEIEIISVLFGEHKSKEVKINQIIRSGFKSCIINPYTEFKFKCVWEYDDPYAYYITRVVFSEKGANALLRYGWRGGFLDGRGFIAYFARKNNIWEKIDEMVEWMS